MFKKWREKGLIMRIVTVLIILFVMLILWMGIDVLRGVLSKDAPRKPSSAGDKADYGYSGIQMAVWLMEHPDRAKNDSIYYAPTEDTSDSVFAWRAVPNKMTQESLTPDNLVEYIRPAAAFMAKRYDCSDFRAIWLCKLRYTIVNSPAYAHLLTPEVDASIRDALTGFKYFITSPGADSMCYYSENHQMVFAVSEYLAGCAYPDDVFTIDGRTGREHAEIARERMNSWFDQRGRYGFSEFLSSNYLAVDIGALAALRTYCEDETLNTKAELALNMIFLDYALQMYDMGMTAPAGRNYARNNTSFNASYASHTIVDRIWHTGETDTDNCYSGFPYLFISLMDSGRYSVPDAIISLGRDNNKGIVKTSSGLTLKEMEEKDLIGLETGQLMFQLGMGALSNEEVIENTLTAISKFDLVHNNFVSSFKYFNITALRMLGLTKKISRSLDPFSNGMAIQRNNVYTYECEDYKLSTDQLYFPGSYGAQQLQQIACLPDRINVFTTNPMKGKEFQGYGVAPCAAQDTNCMLAIWNIPEGNILLATGDTRHYTATYLPEEKFDELTVDGSYAFGRAGNSYIALIGASELRYETYGSAEEFERKIADGYELYEGDVGPDIDAFRLTDYTKGFELRQQGDEQFMIYEMGSASNESFEAFKTRIKANKLSFAGNVLTYATLSADLKKQVTYVLDYSGSFTVNGRAVDNRHDRYDSAFVRAGREDETIRVEHGGSIYEFDLRRMYK